MCIATSWTARKVAVLALIVEVVAFVFSCYLLNAMPGSFDGRPFFAAASAIVCLACIATLPSKPPSIGRHLAAAMIVVALAARGGWYMSVRHTRNEWAAHITAVCEEHPTGLQRADPQLVAASPALRALRDSLPQQSPPVSDDYIVASAQTTMAAQAAWVEQVHKQSRLRERVRERPGPGGVHGRMRNEKTKQARMCHAALQQAVLGSLADLLTCAMIFASIAALLDFLVAARVWCEDTARGKAFHKWMDLDHFGDLDKEM